MTEFERLRNKIVDAGKAAFDAQEKFAAAAHAKREAETARTRAFCDLQFARAELMKHLNDEAGLSSEVGPRGPLEEIDPASWFDYPRCDG